MGTSGLPRSLHSPQMAPAAQLSLKGERALLRRREGESYFLLPATFLLTVKLFTQTRGRATPQSKAAEDQMVILRH